MTKEEKYLLHGIQRRAALLSRFAGNVAKGDGSPLKPIMVSMAWNLLRTIMLLAGPEFHSEVLRWMFKKHQDDAGLCKLCGVLKDTPTDIVCSSCTKSFEETDRELEALDLMDQPFKGKAS